MLSKLRNNPVFISVAKNFSSLFIGRMIIQVLAFVGFYFLVNYLGGHGYGILSVVMSFVTLFHIFTINQLNKVLVREGSKNIKRLESLYRKTTGLKTFMALFSILVCLIAIFFTPYENQTRLLIALFSLNLIFLAFEGYLYVPFQALEKMHYIAIFQVMNKLIYYSLTILFLLLGFDVLAVLIIMLASNFFTLLLIFISSNKFVKIKFRRGLYRNKKIIVPTLILSTMMFLSFLTYRIDLIMISFFRPYTDVGIYGVSIRLLDPGTGIGHLLSMAVFPIFVKKYNVGRINWRSIVKYSAIMGIVLLIIASILSLFSRLIITTLFKPEIYPAIPIFSLLIFTIVVNIIGLPFYQSLIATHNEKHVLKIIWLAPALNIILNYFFLMKFGLIGVAYSTLIVVSLSTLMSIFLFFFLLKRQNKIF